MSARDLYGDKGSRQRYFARWALLMFIAFEIALLTWGGIRMLVGFAFGGLMASIFVSWDEEWRRR